MHSATDASAIRAPRPMTMRWSAVTAISLIRCEDTKTVLPSAASAFIRFRIHSTPSGSSPFTGSSRIRISGSPSSAAAMPRRCPMPSENPPARRPAASRSPTRARTSSTRASGSPWLSARHARWWRAARPLCTARASSSAPTFRNGSRSAAYGRPSIVAVPVPGRSRPRIRRIVVDLPAPLGPRKPVILPGWMENVRWSTAVRSP